MFAAPMMPVPAGLPGRVFDQDPMAQAFGTHHLPGSAGAAQASQSGVASAGGPTQHRFQPYEDNGGTSLGVSGKDFAILGSDTRLSRGYSILTRESSKQIQLTDKCVLVSAGMKADRDTLQKVRCRVGRFLNRPAGSELVVHRC